MKKILLALLLFTTPVMSTELPVDLKKHSIAIGTLIGKLEACNFYTVDIEMKFQSKLHKIAIGYDKKHYFNSLDLYYETKKKFANRYISKDSCEKLKNLMDMDYGLRIRERHY